MAPTVTYAMVAKGIAPPAKLIAMKKIEKKRIAVAVPRLEDVERMRQFHRDAEAAAATKGQVQNSIQPAKIDSSPDALVPSTNNLFNEIPQSRSSVELSNPAALATPTKRDSFSTQMSNESKSCEAEDSNKETDSTHTTSDENGAGCDWVPRENETFVNTIDQVHKFLPKLLNLKKDATKIFCDMEGENLGKPPGTISLLQMTIGGYTWIFDVTVLGKKVFNTMGPHGQSIRGVFESTGIIKVWWDVRNDANALYFHYQIRLDGVEDMQLMELATRTGRSRERRAGLGDCVGVEGVASGKMTREEAYNWTAVKRAGKSYFKTNALGYGVFDVRPLPPLARMYAGQDTCHMPMLYSVYLGRMRYAEFSMDFVVKETSLEVEESCKESWKPQGDFRGQHAYAPDAFSGETREEEVRYIRI